VCVNQGLVNWTFNGGTEIFQVSFKKKSICDSKIKERLTGLERHGGEYTFGWTIPLKVNT